MSDKERIRQLEQKIHAQAAELDNMRHVLERKNKELQALHFVWCSGPCGLPLSKEIVEEAIRNTDRLVEKFNGQRSNRAWRLLADYPDEQNALVASWATARRYMDRALAAEKALAGREER